MLNVKKLNNGLSINGDDKTFTYTHFKTGFDVISYQHVTIELNENMICFRSDDTLIDGVGPFNDVEELLEEIYGELP